MKKIILFILTVFYSVFSYCQFSQNFEAPAVSVPNGFPVGWLVTDNGVGTSMSWEITDNPSAVINGTKSAYINRQQIGSGNTSEDWLVTPSTAIPTNGQLKFATRQLLAGDQGTIYQIRVSAGTSQSNLSSYTVVQQWTETQLNPTFNIPEQKVVNFPVSTYGTAVYIAFVRVYTQPTASQGGDRWFIDDINVVQKCLNPTALSVANSTATSAQLSWNAVPGSVGYELEIIPSTSQPIGVQTHISPVNNFSITGLNDNTAYKFYVRNKCSTDNFSNWTGPFQFQTFSLGYSCSEPIVIASLPYSTYNNTGNFANTLLGPQLSSCIAGTTNYQAGRDVFYRYTATEDGIVSFTSTSNIPNSSLFIYPSCAGLAGACLGGVGNNSNSPRILNYAVTAGTTYIVVISSSSISQNIPYNLLIQRENCLGKPTNLAVSDITNTTAFLNWTAPATPPISYQVVVQIQGSSVPTDEDGEAQFTGITTPNYTIIGLTQGLSYQYWVRSECAPGVFSAWVGPRPFNLESCPKPINQAVTQITTTSALLAWTPAENTALFDVLLLAAPNADPPSTPGINPVVGIADLFFPNISQSQFAATSLAPATIYYYYVRAICQPENDKSAWTGPFIFNTITCNEVEKCTYKFFLTNQGINSWNGGRMQVRQNGIVVATFGTGGINSENGVSVSICNNVPFDLFWNIAGTQPQQIGIKIENSFGDLIYTKLPGQGNPITALFVDNTSGNCMPPTCLKPQDLSESFLSANSATLTWAESGSAMQWEVFVSQNGLIPVNNAPLNTGIPNYYIANTTTAFLIPNLSPFTTYEFYVRAICSSTDLSTWKKLTVAPLDKIILTAFVDSNTNGVKDATEFNFSYGSFTYIKNNVGPTSYLSVPSGVVPIYDFNPANTYDFNYQIDSEYTPYYAATPTNFNDINIATGSGTQMLYFPITILQSYTDVSVVLVPINSPRPGFTFTHKIVYRNMGNVPTSGIVTYNKNTASIVITTILPAATSTNATGFTYNYSNLMPGEVREIVVTMLVPTIPTVNLGDIVTASVSISSSISDMNTANNVFPIAQTVVGSYDPNDKNEARGTTIPIGQFTQNDYLFYTIRFQNTGTASAETVRIEDFLQSQFDLASVRMLSASHNYSLERINTKLIWTFNNINLPEAFQNEVLSQGYVTFKIKLNPGFAVGDVIANTAQIYFDFNPAIITNTFQTTFVPNLTSGSFSLNNAVVYPNPAKELVNVQLKNSSETLKTIMIYDMIGKIIKTVSGNASQQSTIHVGDLASGAYMIEITTDSNLKQIRKFIVH